MIKVIAMLMLFLPIASCAVPTKTWPDAGRDYVWTAMVAAANAPDYSSEDPRKRWIVLENDVDVNPTLARIVIRRKLSRSLKLPKQNEQTDHREWLFVIRLLPEDSPTVTFDVPETQLVPARILDEADRYFMQVDDLLHPLQ